MTAIPKDILDVAIVGGGISGLYSGWRLLTGQRKGKAATAKRVTVFESSPRTGGRLLTWHPLPETDPQLNAELGGMRFFQQQELVWNLIVKHFGKQGKLQKPLRFFVGDPNGNNLWYLRQTILKGADLTNPDRLPYRLDALGRYADPASILNGVIGRLLTANREHVTSRLAGNMMPASWEDWDAIKPDLRYRDRRLWDVGFWNLLWDQLSPETYDYVTDAFGYYSLTNNWNAAEAMQTIFTDFTQNPDYHTLHEGFEALPQLVREEFEEANGKVLVKTPVVSVERAGSGMYHLQIEGADQPVRARHVILAMPRRSLELLKETSLWSLNRVIREGDRGPRTLGEHVRSVIPYPAFKLFLTYATPWWRESPVSIAAGRTVCDIPLRQTYYFPPVPGGFPAANPPLEGPGLVMASYDDLNAVAFWQTLEATEEWREKSDALMKKTMDEPRRIAVTGGSARLRKYAEETQEALIRDTGFYYAPPEMVRYAQEQLSMVHFNRPLPAPLPHPHAVGSFLAAYKDWGVDPFGGGWNFWAPLVDVQAVMERMRRPFDDEAIYIVGEAYSGAQGWVEGALTTTEKMLRESFGLLPAPWQPSEYYMGY
jgi:predicted NAD/FAD-dependent oxidoreductase